MPVRVYALLIMGSFSAACTIDDIIARVVSDAGTPDAMVDAGTPDAMADAGAAPCTTSGCLEACSPWTPSAESCATPRAPLACIGDAPCPAEPGQGFRFALCICDDYVGMAPITTQGSASPMPYNAGIGINGALDTGANLSVAGPLWVAGSGGIHAYDEADLIISTDLLSAGSLRSEAMVQVAGDATVTGDLRAAALHVAGTLIMPPDAEVEAEDMELGAMRTSLVEVPAPCGCGANQRFDIVEYVQAHRADNDNQSIGIDAFIVDRYTGSTELQLPCGRYHLSRLAGEGDLHLRARGPVVLLVDSDVAIEGALHLQVDAQTSLDLFVAGNLLVTGTIHVEGEGAPADVRLHVGGAGTIDLSTDSSLGGGLYAPGAELVTRGALHAVGPLFVRRLSAGGPVAIQRERPLVAPTCLEAP